MRSGGQATASWRRILLLALAMTLWSAVAMAKDKPDVSVTSLNHRPLNINYFEDSDVVIFYDVEEANIYLSENAGATWDSVDAIPEGVVIMLYMHKFDSNTAFALTDGLEHYKTGDRGKSWTKFKSGTLPSAFQAETLVFHAEDPGRIIFNGMACDGIFCTEEAVYTTDGFNNVEYLRAYTNGCWWAKSSKEFTTGDEDKDKSRTMCIVMDPFSFYKEDQRLHVSDSFFAVIDDRIDEFEPNVDANKGVDGVANLAVVKKYILVATSSPGSDEMALYVSDDTITWHRAMFPTDDSHDHSHRISQNAYTVLESTNYSIQVDVMTSHPSTPMGILFTSNSNGTYFIENIPYTNRNDRGTVDFEKMSGIQGIYLVNIVENGEDVEKVGEEKKVQSRITFDDGWTFEELKADGETLHLHSETELDNIGRVFSSLAPGLVMGNGNTGETLGDVMDADLYVSDDAGLNWKKALDGPHKYEFGDSGSVLMAIRDSEEVDIKEFFYSLDHGENWESVELPDGLTIKPSLLTTTQDSTSLKFLLLGENNDGAYHIIAIDFGGLNERTCGEDDMEDWHARVDEDGNPTCIMGHKQTYRRRKKDADCFINNDKFEDPVPKTEDCACSDKDFECDYNFERDQDDHSKCKPIVIQKPEGACKDGDEGTFKGSSGWRLIPGNTCNRGDGKQKDDEVEWKCSEADSPPNGGPASGEISDTKFFFDDDSGLGDLEKIYLERGSSSAENDETVIARPAVDEGNGHITIGNKIWLTSDHGKNWKRILEGEQVRGIFPHHHFNDVVFFTTKDKKVIYTIDRGRSFHTFEAPTEPGDALPISFHPDNKDWLIWIGKKCDGLGGNDACRLDAYISTDRGDGWNHLYSYVKKCEFTGHSAYTRFRPEKQIVCLAREEERNDAELTVVTSNDFFKEDKSEFKGEVAEFATMSEFIVLAGKNEETKELRAYASLNGKLFEEAQFPYNFHDGHDNEYTVLDSSTHAVNLFVLTEEGSGGQYGSVIRSNSNGTSYVLSASKVNCDEKMYVDFEKVPGIEGVTLINVVTNADKNDKKKELQTKISHNDGNEWGYLAPPSKDVEGNSYECSSPRGDKSCALHIHHYTERDDKRKTFAATTAVGLIFAIGNVGSSLGGIEDADTFMSTDGGITWNNVKKGHWTWQYGDQGSIIVLVQRATRKNDVKTKYVSYSLDEGRTWNDYQFAKNDVTVLDITTVRTGASRNFLIWGKTNEGKLFSANLDFTGLADRPCQWTDGDDSDYYLWSPKHPLQDDDCLFGHVAKYLRKKPDSQCYNDQNLKRLHDYSHCPCARQDYEWWVPLPYFPRS